MCQNKQTIPLFCNTLFTKNEQCVYNASPIIKPSLFKRRSSVNNLKRMEYFVSVVQAGSFSKAAIQLGKTKSVISKQISLFEEDVNAKLLHRTTRQLSLTEAGKTFYQHCCKIMERSEFALNELRQHQSQPSGTLRLACPIFFGSEFVVPIVRDFLQLYPELKVDLLMDDKINNTVAEGVDISIRAGWLSDSDLVAKKLLSSPMCIVASPEYLEKHGGQPTKVSQLKNLEAIHFTQLPSPTAWRFKKKNRSYAARLHHRTTVNCVSGLRSLALAGQGVAMMAYFSIKKDINNGHLVQLLPDYQLEEFGYYAVFPKQTHMPSKTRLFLNYLAKNLHSL